MRRKKRLHIGRLIIALAGLAAVCAGLYFGGKAVLSLFEKDENPTVVISGVPQTPTTETNTDSNTYIGTVMIDPGHGGIDPGCNNGDILEKDINLAIALKLGQILESSNVKVYYTRTDDSNLTLDTYAVDTNGTTATTDLRARAELGETVDADLFISLHVDSTGDGSTSNGYTVYMHGGHPDSTDFGNYINSALTALNYTPSKGVLDGQSFRVLRCNTTIAILVEMGYITGDLNYLTDDASQTALAGALAQGVVAKLKAGMLEPDLVLEKQPDLY